MSQKKRREDDGPRIHRVAEKDELEKYPSHLFDIYEDELLADDVGDDEFEEEYETDNWLDSEDDDLGLHLSRD